MIIAGILCGIAGGLLLIMVFYSLALEALLKRERRERKQRILNYQAERHLIKEF